MKIQIPSHTKISLITRLRSSQNPSVDNKYTLFTTNNNLPTNILYYSENPISNLSNDISKLNSFNFDKVYPPNYSINSIYQEILKNPINDLFYNKNSCIFFFGPSSGGKSYLCRGSTMINENETGLLTTTVNDIFKKIGINSDFIIKISVYQIYLNKIYDLLLDNNNEIFDINGLNKQEIKNIKEFDSVLRNAINNRKNLSTNLNMNINDIKKMSHLIISFYIENKKEINIIPFSQIDFIELVSCDYGLLSENEINNNMQNEIYINTNYAFNAIADNMINLSKNTASKNINNNHILISSLKNTMKVNSNIILFNCIIPWEFPLKHSYNSSKFINMIYNQIKDFTKINNNKISYFLDYNKINNNIGKNQNYNDNNFNNNLNNQRMNEYLNSLTIDKMNKIIPQKENNINNRNNKVDKYLVKLPKTDNNTNKTNNRSKNKKPIMNNNKRKGINNREMKSSRIKLSFDIKHPPEKLSKLNEINKALKELEKQNKKLNLISKEESEIEKNIFNNKNDSDEIININNSKNILETKDDNISYAELKSDNIIMREDIERLQQANKNLEYYLSEERNRNFKIINQNEELENKIINLEQILKETKIKEEKNKINEINIEKILNEKMQIDSKLNDNMAEMAKLKEEKDYYEVEYKVLSKQFTELKNNYDILLNEFNDTKKTHDEQLNSVEEKVDNLLNEIDKLRNENSLLRKDNENLGLNLNEMNNQNMEYKEQVNEIKKENEILNNKYNELMKEYDKFKMEKMNEDMLKYKFEENKKIKNENKMKIVNELQSKIQNYRKQRFNQDINNDN